jgi:PAS domain S-box-containing protein
VIAPRRHFARAALLRAAALVVFVTLARGALAAEAPSAAARQFVAAHPVWRVSGDPDWRPYSFRGADGTIVGLDVEFARVLGERIGVRLEWVDVPSWSEALARYRAGEIDLLMGTARSPERDGEMLFTASYAASPVAVITRLDSPFLVTLHDLRGQTVAVPEAHITTDHLERLRPAFALVTYRDIDSAAKAVAEGEADAMVAGLIPSATAVRALGLEELKVAGLVDMRFDLCVAVRRDWPVARALLDAAIAADPPEVRIERFDRWLGPIMGLQHQAWAWRRLVRAGAGIAAALALAVLGVAAWNRVLRTRVDRATRAMREEIAARSESELRFRAMFDQAPIGMYRSTPEGAFLSVNPFLARLFEYESPEQMVREVNRSGIAGTLFDDPQLRPRIVASVLERPGGQVVSQVRYRSRSGRAFDTLLSMTAVDDPAVGQRTLLGFVQDVTARVRDEAIRRQQEKLVALGQLAGGVAHDFNNLLSVIHTEAELLAHDRPADSVVTEAVQHISEAEAGARALTSRLLRFVRSRGGESPTSYDPRDALRTAVELFDSAGGRRVRVSTELGEGATRVSGFREDLVSSVLNLCLNARDAMPNGGRLLVRARDVTLSAAQCAALAPYTPSPGAFFEIEVIDDGTGMGPETLAACTQPFFSTKGEGGTGLGLWMVQWVVSAQGGAMRITSRVGSGTTVALYLPTSAAATAGAGASGWASAPLPPGSGPQSGTS